MIYIKSQETFQNKTLHGIHLVNAHILYRFILDHSYFGTCEKLPKRNG